MLDKNYKASETEQRIYKQWENSGAFKCGHKDRKDAEPFCIVIPPPNVTGSLHMGHALDNTIQDILVRFERLRGKDVLWQPGTDHAGIATQMVVERRLADQGLPGRRDLGREKFLEEVWSWKEQSGGTIMSQLRRLGASCDWSRERFTMDEGLSKAVTKVFVSLYNDGLIYKDKRLVNWDPKLLTAISDLEVIPKETKGKMWHFKYPIKGSSGKFITIATTRPETMLGDTGIAVHPDDERYSDLIGEFAILPIIGREIPIVADDYADPYQGSGAVKITPAHDFNDFEVGRRNGLEVINIFDEHACLNDNVPDSYRGLERFTAREKVILEMKELGLVADIVDHMHAVPYGDRSNVVIEPLLTDQWYVNAAELAKPAIAAVQNKETVFVPANWEKTYFEWMNNIQPWCISRQLWWGHQIPAWYGDDGKVFVAETEVEAKKMAFDYYGNEVKLNRDEDVLDTWFSSALWPFSTLGWPDDTEELQRYYKTDVLVTGFDIIFFWIARMMMMGLHFMKDSNGNPEVPFHTVYIHALVRDANGQKMSKSKGNVVDPIEFIDKYGADALRFTLTAMCSKGRDIKLSESRVEGYRNFATKLWNASRFCQMNQCVYDRSFDPIDAQMPLNMWLRGEVQKVQDIITKAIETHRYNDAASAIYQFIWHKFCDWYLELAKPTFNSIDENKLAEVRKMTAWALQQALILLHPMMPFITEELWHKLELSMDGKDLILSSWPNNKGYIDHDADNEINLIMEIITAIRSVRSELNVPVKAKIPCVLTNVENTVYSIISGYLSDIKVLAGISSIQNADNLPEGSVQTVVGDITISLILSDVVDINAEIERLQKEIAKINNEINKIDSKLNNSNFLMKAPKSVVSEQEERKKEEEDKRSQLILAIDKLQKMQ